MNNKIIEKVEDIVDTIKNTKEYEDYKFLFNKLLGNQQANSLINEVKSLQKKIVEKQVLKESTIQLEEKLNFDLEKLNKIPLYVEFVEKQQELNQIYQFVKEKLDNYFYDVLN